MEAGFVNTSLKDGILYVVFGHPKGNSLPSELLKKLSAAFSDNTGNNEIKAVCLSSEGDGTFCAGASFDELIAVKNEDEAKEFFGGFALVIKAMKNFDKPVVTKVQGKAVGGAVGIIAASDYVLASEQASIRLSELAIGIGPFVIAPVIERKAGIAVLSEMTIDTEWRDAYWACKKGFYAEVFETPGELENEVEKLLQKLAGYSIEALVEIKKMLWHGTESLDMMLDKRAEISGRLVLSEFTKEYLRKFKSK